MNQVLKTAKADTNKVNTLNALARVLYSDNDSSCLRISYEALALSYRLNFKNGIVTAYTMIGDYYNASTSGTSLSELAIKNYLLAVEHLDPGKEKNIMAGIYKRIGRVYYYSQTNFAEALNYSIRALKIYEETGDKSSMAQCLCICGIIYGDQKNFAEATQNMNECLQIAVELKDSVQIAYASNILASQLIQQRKFDEALKNCLTALDIYEKLGKRGPTWGVAWTYSYLGTIYQEEGVIEYKRGDRAKGEIKLNEALRIFQLRLKTEREGGMSSEDSYINLANWYINKITLGKNANQSLLEEKARKYLEQAQESAITHNRYNLFANVYESISTLDSIQGKYKDAFDHYKLFRFYHDSLFNEKSASAATQLRLQYEFDKKKAIEQTTQELKDSRQRNVKNIFLSAFLISFVFLGVVFRQRNRIEKARKRSDELLLNILPSETAEELKATGTTKAKDFDVVTVLFTDFKNFTALSAQMSAQELVNEINYCYSAFDAIIQKYGIEKIKTVGDSYMCAGGLPVANTTNAEDTVRAALEIRDFMLKEKELRTIQGQSFFEIRIGLHTGPVVAGIVGVKKFAYDIWGDTVNIASRMESGSEAGKINISQSTYERVKDKFECIPRGKIHAKNMGEIEMYFVERVL